MKLNQSLKLSSIVCHVILLHLMPDDNINSKETLFKKLCKEICNIKNHIISTKHTFFIYNSFKSAQYKKPCYRSYCIYKYQCKIIEIQNVLFIASIYCLLIQVILTSILFIDFTFVPVVLKLFSY